MAFLYSVLLRDSGHSVIMSLISSSALSVFSRVVPVDLHAYIAFNHQLLRPLLYLLIDKNVRSPT